MDGAGAEPWLGFALALVSGAGWTGLDAIRKRLGASLPPLAILLGVSLAQLPLYLALLAWEGVPAMEPAFAGWLLAAAAIAIAANALLIRGLSLSPLSLVTPYLSFTPAVTVLSGGLLLGQRPSVLGAVGVAVVVIGAFGLSAGEPRVRRHPLAALAAAPGSRLALAVAVLFAFGNAVDRRAVLTASEPAYAAGLTATMAIVLALHAPSRRSLLARRESFGWLALAGGVTATAFLAQLESFAILPVAYTDAVKRAGGNVVAVLLGALLFAEGQAGRRLLAVLVMSAGVALIVLG